MPPAITWLWASMKPGVRTWSAKSSLRVYRLCFVPHESARAIADAAGEELLEPVAPADRAVA